MLLSLETTGLFNGFVVKVDPGHTPKFNEQASSTTLVYVRQLLNLASVLGCLVWFAFLHQ
jgi:hypothetical protein